MDDRISRRRVLQASAAFAALSTPFAIFADGAAPIATTRAGKVQGVVEDGVNVFKGVRYGADTALTRFQAPRAPQPWSGIASALKYGNQTPQGAPSSGYDGGLLRSWANRMPDSEDCLFLNVWTRGLNDGRKRPVMVWFHGGGFSAGSGSSHAYDGVRLAKRGDVVVVTVNHRLNLFGHLYLAGLGNPKYADSGNTGILDLVLALRWVRDNIAQFGGDPDSVLIFGESGGGAKVTTLMAMPAAKGLFHRAVVESGAWLLFNEPDAATKATRALLKELNVPEQNLEQLDKLPVATIQAAAEKVGRELGLASGPVIDHRNLHRHPFTPDAPVESRDVPLLIGMNRTETTYLQGIRDESLFSLTWETLPGKLAPLIKGVDATQIIATYRRMHPAYSPSDLYFAATTDSRILRAHTAEVERKSALHAQGGAPAYFYYLDWDTPVDGGKWRAPHTLEIGLVFDNVAKSESVYGKGPEPQRIADFMSDAWIAFARTGSPQTKTLPKWPAYDAKARATMVFGLTPKVVNDVHGEERRLFDALTMGANG